MPLSPVDPARVPALSDAEAAPPDDLPRGDALAEATAALSARLGELQTLLTAEGGRAVLVVLQGPRRVGQGRHGAARVRRVQPDGPARHVVPGAVGRGAGARLPVARARRAAAARGDRHLQPLALRGRGRGAGARAGADAVWRRRSHHIVEFERMLADEGTVVLKFLLHVSRAEQAERLRARLDEPDKHWKYNAGDVEDRARWDAFTEAYRDVLAETSTAHAPWYVVPGDKKKARNYLVAEALVRALEALAPKAPVLPAERLAAMRAGLDAQLAAEGRA
jgi:polyphosphate kinase 2 (PPK2 family)